VSAEVLGEGGGFNRRNDGVVPLQERCLLLECASEVGGAAGSVAVQRQQKNGKKNTDLASSKRKALNRKSAFFGLVGRGTGKKE